jgi:hypothetical protein
MLTMLLMGVSLCLFVFLLREYGRAEFWKREASVTNQALTLLRQRRVDDSPGARVRRAAVSAKRKLGTA